MSTTTFTPAADDFDTVFDDDHTFPFFEDENGDGVYGYGHQDRDEFAELLNLYDRLCDGSGSEYTADNTAHHWAVIHAGDTDDKYDWSFSWAGITEDTDGAFPLTVILR